MVGLKYDSKLKKDLPEDSQMKTVYKSIKFIVEFHVDVLQQFHLPVNSIFRIHEIINHLRLFKLFNIPNDNINSTFKLERKLG